jgi:hypothetical protein
MRLENAHLTRHSRESGNPASHKERHWVPAFAGTTVIVACLALLAACAGLSRDRGPDVPAPTYHVGDRWVYAAQDGFRSKATWVETHEVTGIGPKGITLRVTQQGDGIDSVRTEQWAAPGQVMTGALYNNETRRFAMPLQRYNFPLAAGNVWNQWVENTDEATTRQGAINRYVVVNGWEQVATPAGTFDAILLHVVMRLDDGEFWRWPTTCDDLVWYAPTVRGVVRTQREAGYVEHSGPEAASVWTQHAVLELREFTPGT